MSRRSFVVIDGLRGIAALMIVVYHANYFFAHQPKEAFLAVDFFFTLSGFVLAYAYGERLRSGLSARQFVQIRLIRLYPLYLLSFMIWLPLAWLAFCSGSIARLPLAVYLASAIFFLPAPISGFLYPLNPPAWSLFFELIANAAYGLLGRRISGFMIVAVVASAALVLIVKTVATGEFEGGYYWANFGSGLARVAYSFSAGILAYRLWQMGKPRIELAAPIVGAALLVVLALPMARSNVYALFSSLAVLPLIVLLGACSRPGALVGRICSWLGSISYAVYALHFPILILTLKFHLPRHPEWGIGFIVLVACVAHIAVRYVDRPVRDYLNDIIFGRARATGQFGFER